MFTIEHGDRTYLTTKYQGEWLKPLLAPLPDEVVEDPRLPALWSELDRCKTETNHGMAGVWGLIREGKVGLALGKFRKLAKVAGFETEL